VASQTKILLLALVKHSAPKRFWTDYATGLVTSKNGHFSKKATYQSRAFQMTETYNLVSLHVKFTRANIFYAGIWHSHGSVDL